MNRRGHWGLIAIVGIISLVIGGFSLYLQLHPPATDPGCQVLTTSTHMTDTNSPVCSTDQRSWAATIANRCTALGFDGYDARAANCNNQSTLSYDCLRVTKECA